MIKIKSDFKCERCAKVVAYPFLHVCEGMLCVECGKEIKRFEARYDFPSGRQCDRCGEKNWKTESDGVWL